MNQPQFSDIYRLSIRVRESDSEIFKLSKFAWQKLCELSYVPFVWAKGFCRCSAAAASPRQFAAVSLATHVETHRGHRALASKLCRYVV
jgi:hypothetical protein